MAFNMRDNMLPQTPKKTRKTTTKKIQKSQEKIDRFFAQEDASPKQEAVVDDHRQVPYVDQYGEQHFAYRTERSAYIRANPKDVLLYWQGPEYEVYKQSTTWYLVTSLIIIAIIFYALFTNSPIMAIVFVLIGVVGYLYINTPPRVMDFAITYNGIVVGNRLYAYDDIVSFWIFYEPPHKRVISLHMHGYITPYIHIALHEVDPVEVRRMLLQFIPEKKQEHTLVDTLERVLHM